jgi:Septum formation
MAKDWKCPHCSTENPGSTLTCSGCGRLQGSVVVPGTQPVVPVPPVPAPSRDPGPSEGWQASTPPPADVSPAPVDSAPANSWAVNLDAVPPASTPLWRRIPVGWLIVALLVVGGGIVGYVFNASRSSTGEISRSGDLTANDLRVGDCFDLKDPEAEEIFDVTAHPCTEAHEYEVFFVGTLTGGDYPTEDAMTTFLVDNCGPAFDTYIGKAYADSALDFSWLSPSPESWRDGDRSVQCAAFDPRNTRLTLSIKGSAQ